MITADASSFAQHVLTQVANTSALEWFGTITGFLCVYLAARQHILNWPIAMLSVGAYAVLFYDYGLYGDAVLQFYFLATAIYGWYYWIKRKEEDQKPIVRLTGRQWALICAAVAVLSALLGFFLDRFTPSEVPYIDGFCTALSFVAQLMLTRKILENWILWIVVDSCYVPLYLYKDLNLTALLYLVFLVLATLGYLDWKKTWRTAA